MIITDKEAVRKALCMPKSFPESGLTPLHPVGQSKFKGDTMPVGWSLNGQFEKDKTYPVYEHEGLFVVGKDGKGYKMTTAAWTKTKWS